jgi:uncharacterized protein (TIGR02266 family)
VRAHIPSGPAGRIIRNIRMMKARALHLPANWEMRVPQSGQIRIPFMKRCVVAAADGPHDGLVCDLSEGGLYVRLDPPPPAGTRVQVTFELFAGDGSPVLTDAVVMWQNSGDARRLADLPPGCGVRFTHVDDVDRARIASLVKAYLTPPAFRSV